MARDWKILLVSQVASHDPVMDEVAHRVAARARRLAMRHAHTRQFAKGIRVKKVRTRQGVIDRVVEVNRPHAWSIEYGHYAGPQGAPNRRFVPGLYIMHRAALREGRGGAGRLAARGRRRRRMRRG